MSDSIDFYGYLSSALRSKESVEMQYLQEASGNRTVLNEVKSMSSLSIEYQLTV